MGLYTKSKAKGHDLDSFVQKNLDIVVGAIRKEVPGLRAVILMGGYGRGEGAVQMVRGKPRLMNDFDMYVITDEQLGDDFLEEVGMKCSRLIGKGGIAHPEGFEKRYDFEEFFHVDIRCIPEKKLGSLPPMQRYYEMGRASTVLWGDKKILGKFPRLGPADIPKPEAIRVIMNRMMLLLMSFTPKFIKRKGYMSKDERGIITYYISKSYLTAAEALLMFSGKFRPTYGERARMFERTFENDFPALSRRYPFLVERVRFFTQYKAAPDPSKVRTIEEWFRCRDVLGAVFRHCLEDYLGEGMPEDWEDVAALLKRRLPYPYFEPYARYYLRRMGIDNPIFRYLSVMGGQLFMNYKYFRKLSAVLKKPYWAAMRLMDHGVRILYVTPLILYSIRRDGSADGGMLRAAMKELKASYPVEETTDWDEAKSYYLKAYRLYYLQRFV